MIQPEMELLVFEEDSGTNIGQSVRGNGDILKVFVICSCGC